MLFPNECFIDSNIFIIASVKKGNQKFKEFIDKVRFGEIKGFINPIVVSEIFHKFAITEIRENMNVSYTEAMQLIKEEPKIIKNLKKAFKAIHEILSYEGIEILGMDEKNVTETIKIAKENELLFNDALIASTCKLNKIENIITNDTDFERLEFLNTIKIN